MGALIAAAAIGAAGTAYGAYSASKTAKENQQLGNQAVADEQKRRQAAAKEATRLMDEYNNLRSERPGLTLQAFISERVQALNDPELNAAFRQFKQEDYDQAQHIADQAASGNIEQFESIVDKISAGKADEFLNKRNEIALSTNEVDAFNRAMQLRSPAIPAGTVKMDSQGRFVEGQRADKQVFQTAFETQEQQRALQFDRVNAILEQDRSAAERQQEKAKDFLSFTDYTGFANAIASEQRAQQLAVQLADEERQFQLIRDFSNAAFSNQTAQPQFQSTSGSDAITRAGIELVGSSLAQYGAKKKE